MLSNIFEQDIIYDLYETENKPKNNLYIANNVKVIMALNDNIFVTYYKKIFLDNDISHYFSLFERLIVYNSDDASKICIMGQYIKIPRQQVAYGDINLSYSFSGTTVKANSWNKNDILCHALRAIKDKVCLISGKKFNFVLINRYKDGNDYIGAHSDDEKELGNNPCIVGVSFGAEREFVFSSKYDNNKHKLMLHNGSLVIMHHPTNKYYKHSIPKNKYIKTPRISLTFRYMI